MGQYRINFTYYQKSLEVSLFRDFRQISRSLIASSECFASIKKCQQVSNGLTESFGFTAIGNSRGLFAEGEGENEIVELDMFRRPEGEKILLDYSLFSWAEIENAKIIYEIKKAFEAFTLKANLNNEEVQIGRDVYRLVDDSGITLFTSPFYFESTAIPSIVEWARKNSYKIRTGNNGLSGDCTIDFTTWKSN